MPPSKSSRRKRYFEVTRTFTYGFVFVLPLLVIYELGIMRVNQTWLVRNGADAILRGLLYSYGNVSFYALSALMIGGLAYQFQRERKRYHLELKWPFFVGMLLESFFYASLLGGVSTTLTRAVLPGLSGIAGASGATVSATGMALQASSATGVALQASSATGVALQASSATGMALQASSATGMVAYQPGLGTQIVMSTGAGIYEEFVFRVLLVSGIFVFLRWLRPAWSSALTYGIAAIGAAAVFSGFHYIGAYGDPLELSSFTFRFMAGLVLNGLYITRGFGIAVWSHALYDVLVALRQAA